MTTTFEHELTDGVAFQELVAKRINDPDPRVWEQLLTPEWVARTDRALINLEMQFQKACSNRRSEMSDAKADFTENEITREKFNEATTDYYEWKARANRYHESLIRYRNLTKEAVRQANIAANRDEMRTQHDALRDVLIHLVDAVEQHRLAVTEEYEPTTVDRLLWARLDLVQFPDTGYPLIDIVRKRRAKQEARVAS